MYSVYGFHARIYIPLNIFIVYFVQERNYCFCQVEFEMLEHQI
jgi:hypothetical protein